MKNSNGEPTLNVEFDVHQCEIPPRDLDEMRQDLLLLSRQLAAFPVSDVHVMIERNHRSNDYSVKISILLPGSTLTGNDHDAAVQAAFQRCLHGLEENVRAYKENMGRVPERQKHEKGTHQDVRASIDPDGKALEQAVESGDYAAFRTAAFGYEEDVRRRIGRWVERYPKVAARIGRGLDVEDIVEAVFLDAFEKYERRPREARLGDWLSDLIDPAVKAIQAGGEDYLENVRLARSAQELELTSARSAAG